MTIDKAIKNFSLFLNDCWNIGKLYDLDQSHVSDWLQANWEILVERTVLDFHNYLEIYGEGADFFGASSRMTDINALPTHSILIKSNSNYGYDILNKKDIELDKLSFEQLVGFKNGFYTIQPDFNFALCTNDLNEESVLDINSIFFDIQKI